MTQQIFNVRVYGILIEKNALLVSDEVHHNRKITKLPGGGLEFGESTIACIKREFMEELSIDIEVSRHFYTVDFFQPSAFNPQQQIISIYYLVHSNQTDNINATESEFDFAEIKNGAQSFRWIPLQQLGVSTFTFPIDKKVAELLLQDIKD